MELVYTDLPEIESCDIDVLLDIYAEEFSEGPTSFPRDEFKKALLSGRHLGKPYGYHFLAIRLMGDDPPRGMASFFTFPRAGFGGYIVLGPSIRGKGFLAEILRTIEQYMTTDRDDVVGWYGECDPADGTAPIFLKRGFYEVDLEYRQPPLYGRSLYTISEAPILNLIYKSLGTSTDRPHITTEEFLSSMAWIFRVIYRIDDPDSCDYYRFLKSQLAAQDYVRLKRSH